MSVFSVRACLIVPNSVNPYSHGQQESPLGRLRTHQFLMFLYFICSWEVLIIIIYVFLTKRVVFLCGGHSSRLFAPLRCYFHAEICCQGNRDVRLWERLKPCEFHDCRSQCLQRFNPTTRSFSHTAGYFFINASFKWLIVIPLILSLLS